MRVSVPSALRHVSAAELRGFRIKIFRTVRLSVTTDCSLHIHFSTHSRSGGLHMTRHDLTRHITRHMR